jgi:tRNA/rRNA methyltransferase
LTDFDFILVEPHEAGNVGAAARALANMGFESLILVDPRYEDERQARKMAVHAAGILKNARRFSSLTEALAEARWVVGLSCRERTHPERKPPMDPDDFGERLSVLPADARVALVFGPEPSGLNNSQLALCRDILRLPTSDEYPSLNLAQAVMLAAWETRRAIVRDHGATRKEKSAVSAGELEQLIEHMRRTLTEIEYLNPENPELILAELRKVLSRAELDKRELSMIRGIFHRMDVWMAFHGGPEAPNKRLKKYRV